MNDPRQSRRFRFLGFSYRNGEVDLRYAFDDGPELVERITFPDAPAVPAHRSGALEQALRLLHLIAGISYYKAGVPQEIQVENHSLDEDAAAFFDKVYLHGLGEFAYRNALNLRQRVRFPGVGKSGSKAQEIELPRRTLVPIGGGKDSIVSVETLKGVAEPMTAVWVGNSPLIAACAANTGLATLNIKRQLSPLLFEYNQSGAWNGHIPVTAINSAIMVVAAVVYGYDAIAFSNERSASSATLQDGDFPVNHQWSKSYAFESAFRDYVHSRIASNLDYFSLLRPWSELAITRWFAGLERYHAVFSSCNRNFKVLGTQPAERWCGKCPKCHFVFLALAPFMAKPRLLAIFGRNFLEDAALQADYDALLEYRAAKPFECVGEAKESRVAMAVLCGRAEWREDALVKRFAAEILPQLDPAQLALAPLLQPGPEHLLPVRLQGLLDAFR